MLLYSLQFSWQGDTQTTGFEETFFSGVSVLWPPFFWHPAIPFLTPLFCHSLCTQGGVVRFRFCDWPFSYWIFISCANYVWMRFYDWPFGVTWSDLQRILHICVYAIQIACVNTHTPSVSHALNLEGLLKSSWNNNDILWGTQCALHRDRVNWSARDSYLRMSASPVICYRRTYNSSAPIILAAFASRRANTCKNEVIVHS